MERSFADVKETSFAQTHKKICQIISVDAELPVANPPKIRRRQSRSVEYLKKGSH